MSDGASGLWWLQFRPFEQPLLCNTRDIWRANAGLLASLPSGRPAERGEFRWLAVPVDDGIPVCERKEIRAFNQVGRPFRPGGPAFHAESHQFRACSVRRPACARTAALQHRPMWISDAGARTRHGYFHAPIQSDTVMALVAGSADNSDHPQIDHHKLGAGTAFRWAFSDPGIRVATALPSWSTLTVSPRSI